MNAEQRQTLQHLSQDLPSVEEVLAELPKLGDKFWRFYYPLCFRYTAEFFNEQTDAENAAMPLFEHWMAAVERYDQDKAKLVTYFDRVAKNFCLNYQRDTSYGPELVFQSEESEVDEEDDEGTATNAVAFVGDYPTDGVDHNDPETLAIQEEDAALQRQHMEDVRAQLYPGDQLVFDLLLENYNSEDIASILERTTVAVENAIRRIRATTVFGG